VAARASAILIAGALFAGALGSCNLVVRPTPATPGPPDRPAPTQVASADPAGSLGLLVLLGTPGDMRLQWLDGDHEVAVPLPDADVRWACGSPAAGLVVTVGPTGRILTTSPFVAGHRPAWREIPIDPGIRRWLAQPFADAVADPATAAVVAVAADPGSSSADGHLVILDRAGGAGRVLALPGRWDGRAPAWLGSGRVAVSTRDRSDVTGLTIVDIATGSTERWGTAVGAFTASGDGRVLAYQDRDDGHIYVGARDRVLSGASPDTLPAEPPVRLAAQLLLDETGERLAIAWLDDAGDTTSYSVYERGPAGWTHGHTRPLPRGTSRPVLVSLGP
jgi:hypothetical protein